MKSHILAAATTVLVGTAMAGSVQAQDQAVDFDGKRIEMIVPFKAGGATDVYGRFFAGKLSEHLPGNPTVVVSNIPGAGGMPGANQFEARAEADGTTLIAMTVSTQLNWLFEDPAAQFDLKNWRPLILTPQREVALVHTDTGATGPQDIKALQDVELRYADHSVRGLSIFRLLGFDGLGLDVTPVWGVSGGPARIAMERGEITLAFASSAAYRKDYASMVDNGVVTPIFSYGDLDADGNVVRDATFPDLPTYLEVYKEINGKELAGPERALYEMHLQFTGASKSLFLPADTPDAVYDAYVAAIQAILDDPAYAEENARFFGEHRQAVGEQAKANLAQALDLNDELKSHLSGWLKQKYDLDL
ncbi:MAG: tricarboxylate transporter [Rhodobacteraceae bacterium]|nr:MAG: tricarboxylate transporter [Paracoccaceae bacterium]